MIKTEITEAGQRYVDRPVYAKPIKLMTRLHDAMAEIFGHVRVVEDVDGFLHRVRTDLPADILLGHQRTWLNWV